MKRLTSDDNGGSLMRSRALPVDFGMALDLSHYGSFSPELSMIPPLNFDSLSGRPQVFPPHHRPQPGISLPGPLETTLTDSTNGLGTPQSTHSKFASQSSYIGGLPPPPPPTGSGEVGTYPPPPPVQLPFSVFNLTPHPCGLSALHLPTQSPSLVDNLSTAQALFVEDRNITRQSQSSPRVQLLTQMIHRQISSILAEGERSPIISHRVTSGSNSMPIPQVTAKEELADIGENGTENFLLHYANTLDSPNEPELSTFGSPSTYAKCLEETHHILDRERALDPRFPTTGNDPQKYTQALCMPSVGEREKKIGRRKGPLRPEQRAQGHEIRKLRACFRCKIMKRVCDKSKPCAACLPSHGDSCTCLVFEDMQEEQLSYWRGELERIWTDFPKLRPLTTKEPCGQVKPSAAISIACASESHSMGSQQINTTMSDNDISPKKPLGTTHYSTYLQSSGVSPSSLRIHTESNSALGDSDVRMYPISRKPDAGHGYSGALIRDTKRKRSWDSGSDEGLDEYWLFNRKITLVGVDVVAELLARWTKVG
jgi:hypothetical protein